MGAKDNFTKNTQGKAKRKTFEREREQFDVSTLFTQDFRDAMEIALAEGGAIRLGCTRDGGALAVGIYGLGAEPSTEYIRPSDDIGQFWRDLTAAFKGSSDL